MLTAWARFTLGVGRVPVLLGTAALTVVLGLAASGASFERSNESMNARSPEQRRVAERFAESFGSDETLVVAMRDERLLEPDGIGRLRELASRIEAIDGVAQVRSLLDAVEIVAGPFGAEESPLVPRDAPYDRARLELGLERDPELLGALVTPDRRTAALLVDVEDRPGDDAYRGRIVERLRELKAEAARDGDEIHVTGITVQKYDTTRFVARDQRVLLPASVAVFALLLVAITRRRSGVVLPLVVTAITLVWTLGLLTALGLTLNVITSLLPPVVMVLAITTSIHLYQEWIELSRFEPHGRRLALAVVERLGAPCALTALTTALGLASLGVSDIPAVRQFGLVAAAGVMISLALNLTLLPLAFATLRPEKRRREAPSRLTPLLDRAVAFTVRHPQAVVVSTVLLTALAVAGIARVRNDTDLMSFLPPDAELVRDTRWVDRELVGTNSLELMIERVDGRPLTDPRDLRALDAFARRVFALDEVTNALSVAAVVARIHQAEQRLAAPALPDDPDDLLYAYDLLADSPHEEDLRALITADLRRARLTVRLHAIGTARGERTIERIAALADEELDGRLTATATGIFHAMVMDSNRLVAGQIASLGLAMATILVALGIYLRSPGLLLAALGPNLVPIAWCFGAMGWLGIDLSTATTMVASVVIGVAVDDTIHYLSRFRREYRGDVEAAVRATTHGTGRVLVIASSVLALGFWVGALGSFQPTVWFSLLTGCTILAALACDLIVLPACLVLVRPARRTMVPMKPTER
jgi:predicted RND superfamily exporter protein